MFNGENLILNYKRYGEFGEGLIIFITAKFDLDFINGRDTCLHGRLGQMLSEVLSDPYLNKRYNLDSFSCDILTKVSVPVKSPPIYSGEFGPIFLEKFTDHDFGVIMISALKGDSIPIISRQSSYSFFIGHDIKNILISDSLNSLKNIEFSIRSDLSTNTLTEKNHIVVVVTMSFPKLFQKYAYDLMQLKER